MRENLSRFGKNVRILLMAIAFLLVSPVTMGFAVDTATSPMTGLWNNENESGWGVAVTQQFGMIFATIYTYDANGNPIWYVASSCPVSGNGCTGDLYQVRGGSALTVPWNGTNKSVNKIGMVNFAFADNGTGTMNYTIGGASGLKSITKAHFADPPTTATPTTAVCNENNFTTAKFNAIALGMTFDQVATIIGCVNSPSFSQHQGSFTILGWAWTNPSTFKTKLIGVWFDSTGVIVSDAYSGQGATPYFKSSSGF